MYTLFYSGSHTVHKIEGFDSKIMQVGHIIDVYKCLYVSHKVLHYCPLSHRPNRVRVHRTTPHLNETNFFFFKALAMLNLNLNPLLVSALWVSLGFKAF